MSGRQNLRWIWAVLGVAVGLLLIWYLMREPRPSNETVSAERAISGTAADLAAGRPPAKVRGAVLYENYEHGRENVPPRNDTRARANAWQPPGIPLEVMRAAIEAQSPGERESELLAWMEAWDKAYREGSGARGSSYGDLPLLLAKTRVRFEPLFEVGVAMGFLENEAVAANFHRAALRRAEEEPGYKNLSPVHEKAAMLRRALPQMGYLWRLGDYAALERRFAIEMQVHPPLSQESRKCAHSCAEAMYYQGKSKEASDLIEKVLERHAQAGDLNTSDKQEMGWIQGIFYSSNRRYEEAAEGLIVAVSSGGQRGGDALRLLGSCVSMAPAEKREELMKKIEGKLSPEQVKTLQAQVDRADEARNRGVPR
jgi:hypothetical protein